MKKIRDFGTVAITWQMQSDIAGRFSGILDLALLLCSCVLLLVHVSRGLFCYHLCIEIEILYNFTVNPATHVGSKQIKLQADPAASVKILDSITLP